MINNDDYSEFPDIDRYAQEEHLSPIVLKEAFEIEAHYHKLLLDEKSFENRLKLYNQLYAKVIPIYNRDPNLAYGYNQKDKYVKLFSRELQGANIIDFGCGSGNMLKSISRQLETKSLTGIDTVISKELRAHQSIEFIEANIIDYYFEKVFDVAFSDNVMEHLVPEDCQRHINSIFKALSDGGKLIIIMPNRLFGPWDITRIKDFSQSGQTDAEGGHVNESTHTEMTERLKIAGFRKVSTIIPIPKLKYSLFRRVRVSTHWVERLEKSPCLLRLFRSLKLKGVCVMTVPVTLIAQK